MLHFHFEGLEGLVRLKQQDSLGRALIADSLEFCEVEDLLQGSYFVLDDGKLWRSLPVSHISEMIGQCDVNGIVPCLATLATRASRTHYPFPFLFFFLPSFNRALRPSRFSKHSLSMAEIAAGALAAEQVISTGVEAGAAATIARSTQLSKVTLTQIKLNVYSSLSISNHRLSPTSS